MNANSSIVVQTYDPIIEFFLFIFLCILALAYIAEGISKFNTYNVFGKGLVIFSLILLMGLIVYCTGLGYWLDEVPRNANYYVEQYFGSNQEDIFLVAICLTNNLAKVFKTPGD